MLHAKVVGTMYGHRGGGGGGRLFIYFMIIMMFENRSTRIVLADLLI